MDGFYIAKNETEIDRVMSADVLMKAAPDYYRDRFQAIADLRAMDDGSLHRGNEFRRVASFVNVPLFMATKMVAPDFLKDKRRFYAFMDRHREFLTYDRRNGGRGTHADELRLPLGVALPDAQDIPLKALGLDYPGGPEDIQEGWEPVVVPLMSSSEIEAEDAPEGAASSDLPESA